MTVRMHSRARAGVLLAAVTVAAVAGATAARAVIGTDEGSTEAYRFAARVEVGAGPERGCSGALVAAQWVLTAKACLGGSPRAGAPAEPVTVTVGRTDLRAATTGRTLAATRVVPHPDRDVVLLRLAARVTDVPPVPVATAAPRTGEQLRLLGFGRSATTWLPDRLHGATVVVDAVGTATLDASAAEPAGATTCQGDAGGPAIRTTGGRAELAGVHHLSGRQGCLDARGTTPRVVETRVDDLAGWIAGATIPACNTAGVVLGADQGGLSSTMPDWNGDCAADIINQNVAGNLHAWLGTGDLSGDWRLFGTHRQVGAGWALPGMPRMLSGDLDGDGRTDLVGQFAGGELRAYRSSADMSGDLRLFPDGKLIGTGWQKSHVDTIMTADVDGDGRTDIVARYANGSVRTWRSTGDLTGDHRLLAGETSVAARTFPPAQYPRMLAADVTGDGRADLVAQAADGTLHAFRSTGDVAGATTPLWAEPARTVGTGWMTAGVSLILTGDVTGDGRVDIGARYASGEIRFWASTGDLSADHRLLAGGHSLIAGMFPASAYPRILVGDADNDGRADVVLQAADGTLHAYRSTGDASADGRLFPGPARTVGSGWTVSSYPRIF